MSATAMTQASRPAEPWRQEGFAAESYGPSHYTPEEWRALLAMLHEEVRTLGRWKMRAGFQRDAEGRFIRETCDLFVELILAETEKALLVVIDGEEHWLPASQIEDFGDGSDGQEWEVSLWWAKLRGIIE